VTKIAGDITATRDYPAAGRADRAGRQVVIVLRVDTQGKPMGCRVQQPSGNDEADAITCRLACNASASPRSMRRDSRLRPITAGASAGGRRGDPIAGTRGLIARSVLAAS
jgi:TonB family protein